MDGLSKAASYCSEEVVDEADFTSTIFILCIAYSCTYDERCMLLHRLSDGCPLHVGGSAFVMWSGVLIMTRISLVCFEYPMTCILLLLRRQTHISTSSSFASLSSPLLQLTFAFLHPPPHV